jgi:hypothetical protein
VAAAVPRRPCAAWLLLGWPGAAAAPLAAAPLALPLLPEPRPVAARTARLAP